MAQQTQDTAVGMDSDNQDFTPAPVSSNAQVILEKRYFVKDHDGTPIEDAQGMFQRVAHAIAQGDKAYGATPTQTRQTEQSFYRMMASLDFLPNSPTLMNAGTGQGTLSACFVLPLQDTMEGIAKASHDQAMVQKFGGGTGFSLSELRPKGSPISTTHGHACGPVETLRYLSATSRLVTQGGKRDGANMAVMDVHHPDILEFIECKQVEGEIHNFNISVGASDEFMQAVENQTQYPLYFRQDPADENSPTVQVGSLNAREVFDKIIDGAWLNGEPGMVFLDEVNRNSPVKHIGTITATNPCVTADTWVMTSSGPRRVSDLRNSFFIAIIDGQEWLTGKHGFFKSGTKPVVKITTHEGYHLRLTRDHKVRKVTKRTHSQVEHQWVEAGDLASDDEIQLHDHRSFNGWSGEGTHDEGHLLGRLVGDASLSKHQRAFMSIWTNEETESTANIGTTEPIHSAIATLTKTLRGGGQNEKYLYLKTIAELATKFDIQRGNNTITHAIEKASSDFYKGFLRGFFDTDSTIDTNHDNSPSIRLARTDLNALETTQRMLLRLGIASKIYKQHPAQDRHELAISKENTIRFADLIGFTDAPKAQKLDQLNERHSTKHEAYTETFTAHVQHLEEDGVEPVYDVQVPGVNAFDANGIYVANCGEQPLLPNESCNLGSINLANFVTEPFAIGVLQRTPEQLKALEPESPPQLAPSDMPAIDWQRMQDTTRLAVHFLDNTIDVNEYAIPEILNMNLKTRKIGLGVMGFADMLVKLGIPYDSEQAVSIGNHVMRFIMQTADSESQNLATQRGPYQAWQGGEPETRGEAPMRNACRLTVAPTGTISMIAGCSSGIEPIFSLAYRKHNILGGDTTLYYADANLERVAKQNGFFSEDLLEALSEGESLQDREDVPEQTKQLFHVASDISPRDHVLMQAAFQQSVDAGISKTINFPNHATRQDVEEAYMLAWKTRCKGITVYRAGSREKEVLTAGHTEDGKQHEYSNGMQPSLIQQGDVAPLITADAFITPMKRPPALLGRTVEVQTGRGKIYVTLNYTDRGRLFEVFTAHGKAGGNDNAMAEALSRMISLSLRSGISPTDIVSQLRMIADAPVWTNGRQVMSVPDAIAQVISQHAEVPPTEHADALQQGETILPSMFGAPSAEQLGMPSASISAEARAIYGAPASEDTCPECFSNMAFEEGCSKCYSCGFSKC